MGLQYNYLLRLRCLTTAITADKHTIEIDTGAQTTATAGGKVPVDGVGLVGGDAGLRTAPQLATRGIEDFKFDVHLTARTVVGNQELCRGGGRILGADDVLEQGRLAGINGELQLGRG